MGSLFGDRSRRAAPPKAVDDSADMAVDVSVDAAVDVSGAIRRLVASQAGFKVSELVEATGLTRQGLHRHIQRAVEAGSIRRVGEGRGTRYEAAGTEARTTPPILDLPVPEKAMAATPDAERSAARRPDRGSPDGERFERSDALDGLPEDVLPAALALWIRQRNPETTFELIEVVEYAVAQLVGNAADHSGSESVQTRAWFTGDRLHVEVGDTGIGALERLRSELHLHDYFHAVQELAKGKATTQPASRDGEGLFFVPRLAARFQLNANGLTWIVNNELDDQTVMADPGGPGTRICLALDLRTCRRLETVVAGFKRGGAIQKTRCSVRLFEHGAEFFTRGQAERLTANLERFAVVELDFKSVEAVGQAFVDAIFRDWAATHPGTELRPINMPSSVEFMVHRGLSSPNPT